MSNFNTKNTKPDFVANYAIVYPSKIAALLMLWEGKFYLEKEWDTQIKNPSWDITSQGIFYNGKPMTYDCKLLPIEI